MRHRENSLKQSTTRLPRVLVVTSQFYPLLGGAEKQIERLAGKFLEKGLSVRVVAARFEPTWPTKERLKNDVEITRLPSLRVRGLGTALFLMRLFFHIIWHRHEYDVIHVQHANYAAFGSVIAARLIGKPVVCRLAGSGKHGDLAALKKTIFPSLIFRIVKKIDRFVAISKHIQDDLREAGFTDEQIVLIPNGVDTDVFCPSPIRDEKTPKATKILLFVGRIDPLKGLDVLLHALGLLSNSCRVKLKVVGSDSSYGEIQELIKRLNILERVEFLGQVEDVRDYLRAADIFVLPSRSEGLSNALLEAMACGLPVVATKTSGTVDVIQDAENGLLVDVEDSKALAAAIKRLLEDFSLARKLAENAVNTVKTSYSLDSVAERYIELYRNLIHEHA